MHYSYKHTNLDNAIKAAFKRKKEEKKKKKTDQGLIAPYHYLQFSSICSKLLTILS